MLMKFSLLAIAAAGASANILLARQSIASGLEGALGSAPQACQSACSALLGVADKCQTADQACLTAICQPDVLASYKSCSDCLIKEVGDQLPQSTRQTLEQGQSALGQVCQSSGGAASGTGTATNSVALGSTSTTNTLRQESGGGPAPTATGTAATSGGGLRSGDDTLSYTSGSGGGGGVVAGSSTPAALPSGTAGSAQPSNAAMAGVQVGVGAGLMGVLGLVAAAL